MNFEADQLLVWFLLGAVVVILVYLNRRGRAVERKQKS
jgi:hypothetical protein